MKTMSDVMPEPGGPVGRRELSILEIARDALETWGDGVSPELAVRVVDLERLGDEAACLAFRALEAWALGDLVTAVERAADAATIEGMAFNRAGGYHRLHEVLCGQA